MELSSVKYVVFLCFTAVGICKDFLESSRKEGATIVLWSVFVVVFVDVVFPLAGHNRVRVSNLISSVSELEPGCDLQSKTTNHEFDQNMIH